MKGDAQKAAAMFVLLGEEAASGIMRHLNEAEIEQLSKEISNIGMISAERVKICSFKKSVSLRSGRNGKDVMGTLLQGKVQIGELSFFEF